MLYLVTMNHPGIRNGQIATMIVDLPEDFSFDGEFSLDNRSATFEKLKQICHDQVPSGFHECCSMLNVSNVKHTKIIAISPIPRSGRY